MDKRLLLKFFQEKGTQKTLKGSFPLPEEGTIFAFTKGIIHICAKQRVLACFTEGLIFSFPKKKGYEICATTEEEIQAWTLTEESLQKEIKEELYQPLQWYLDAWIEQLSRLFIRPLFTPPKGSIPLTKEMQVEENQNLYASLETTKGVKWLFLQEGSLSLFGEKTFLLSSSERKWFPLSVHPWFSVTSQGKLQTVDSLYLIQNNLWEEALSSFSLFLLNYLDPLLKKLEEKEKALLKSRDSEDRENLISALKELKLSLSPTFQEDLQKLKDPLEQACQILSKELKCSFVFPSTQRSSLEDIEERLEEICEASLIRKRRIKLSPTWWKENHGPLLGFFGEELHPVALLPSYRMIDKSGSRKVTSTLAKEFSSVAYMFYIPFPTHLKKGKEIIHFFLRRQGKLLGFFSLFGIVNMFFSFFPSFATNLLFTYAVPENSFPLIWYLFFGLLFSSIGASFFYFLRELTFLRIEENRTHLIQTAFWDRLLKLSPYFFRKFTIGNLFWRIISIEEIRRLMSAQISRQFFSGIFSFFYLGVMFWFSSSLAATVLGFVSIGLLITGICSYLRIGLLKKLFEIQGNIRGFVLQLIGGVSKLRVAGAEKSGFSNWASLFASSRAIQMKAQTIQNVATTVNATLPLLSFWGIYLALFYGGPKEITTPHFLAFILAFGGFSSAIFPLNNALLEASLIFPLWERAKIILEEPLEEEENKISPGNLTGEVQVDELVFSYDKEGKPILGGISLYAKPQEFIAVVGPSGSGKSTLIRLLLGFEKPVSGGIYYDGKDLGKLYVKALRKQIGIVLQEAGIMAGSIYDNIVCGGRYTEETIEKALLLSSFAEDLASMPMGLHTFIQINGRNLSGGQKQRLLLARALLNSPPLLIFDEATSALDNRSQKIISQNMEKLHSTRIVIAQRLSTIQNADRIYVLHEGKIQQEGTFEELAKQKEQLFALMLQRQRL